MQCSGYIKGSIWRGEITYALFLVQSRTLLLPAACCLLPSRNPERRHRRPKTAARRHSGVTVDLCPFQPRRSEKINCHHGPENIRQRGLVSYNEQVPGPLLRSYDGDVEK